MGKDWFESTKMTTSQPLCTPALSLTFSSLWRRKNRTLFHPSSRVSATWTVCARQPWSCSGSTFHSVAHLYTSHMKPRPALIYSSHLFNSSEKWKSLQAAGPTRNSLVKNELQEGQLSFLSLSLFSSSPIKILHCLEQALITVGRLLGDCPSDLFKTRPRSPGEVGCLFVYIVHKQASVCHLFTLMFLSSWHGDGDLPGQWCDV